MLENPKSARVRRVAGLSRKKERQHLGEFLVEGPQAVRELLTHQPERARVVYATMGTESWQYEVDRLASDTGVPLERVTDEVLSVMAETVNPQGVLAVATISEPSLDQALHSAKLVAIMHEVRDPGNAGAVLRAADAAGADAVIFAGDSIDPWHPKVVRATTGSLFHLPVLTTPTLTDALVAVRGAGLSVLAADVNGRDLTPGDVSLRGSVAWLFGNEARGLTAEDREQADGVLRLPIYGEAESLNLATAAAVCLYTTAFAQRSV